MRFKKGDKVEVMNNSAVPISWRPGQILDGGDRFYHVQYDFDPSMGGDQMVEMVSKKCVRPLPPLMHDLGSYNPGDIVEVFYGNSWKVAVVLKFMGGKEIMQTVQSLHNQYLVRLLGTLQELIVYRLSMRIRQTWHGGKWTLMGKTSQASNDLISGKPSASSCCKTMGIREPQFNAMAKHHPGNDSMRSQDNTALWNSPLVSGRSRKRLSPYGSSIVETRNGKVKKLRAMEKEERLVAARDLEKVDAVAYPLLGEKNMHASTKIIISNRYNQSERAKQNDSDSDACSVGSCSVTNCYNHCSPTNCEESENLCSSSSSDAESSTCCSGSERRDFSSVETSIRRLEVRAYRKTLEALYASGPLSWDQEAVLTNLRIMLHISNDQHLKELKHLISTRTSLSVEKR